MAGQGKTDVEQALGADADSARQQAQQPGPPKDAPKPKTPAPAQSTPQPPVTP